MEHLHTVSTESSVSLQTIYNLFDEVPFAVAVFKGPSLVIEYVNQFTLSVWQLERHEVIGKPLFQVRPDIQQHTRHIHEEVYRTGKRFKANEAPLTITTNGIAQTRYFNTVIDPVYNESGEMIGQLSTVQEVTEQVLARKKLEEQILADEKIKETENLFRIALDGAEMGTFDFNPQTGRLKWSDKTKEHFGLPPDSEVSFDVFLNALHPADRERSAATTEHVLKPENGGHYENEYRTVSPDGTIRWIRSKGKVSFDNNGKPIRFAGVTQDITSQKAAEKDLKESEARFRSLIEEAPVATCLFVGREMKIEVVNDIMIKYWGKGRSVYGKPVREALPELEGQPYFQLLDEVFTTGNAYHTSAMPAHLAVHGVMATYYFDFTYKPLRNAEGEVYGIMNMAVDVTEQVLAVKNLEESESRYRLLTNQLEALVDERTKELQRSNEDLQQFAHVASHDLKEPVRKVMTFTNRLKDELSGIETEKTTKYISKIESSAARMNAMIDGVLLYSSLDALEQSAEIIDLEDLIESIESDLEVLIAQKQASIVYKDLPTITASSILIYQLFFNLVNNSLKFTKPGTPCIIDIVQEELKEEELSHLGLNTTKQFVKIVVRDNGIGFDNSEAKNIFGAFTRLHSKDKFEGTGLGLALCKKIVQRHGGAIYGVGEENQYASFSIILPR